MTTVCFSTFCHPPHLSKLHAPGVLDEIIASHQFSFDEAIVVHQRCLGLSYRPFNDPAIRIVESEDYYPQIYDRFRIDLNNPISARDCHGPGAAHWWAWHTLNHLIVLEEARSDYIVFSDCDTLIINSDPAKSWIQEAIEILETYPEVHIVSPGEGGSMAEAKLPDDQARLTRNVSQQLFITECKRFKQTDFDIPWNWEFLAPGGPMAEYYHMLEGRIWRYLHKHQLWRAILPDKWRYWHYNPWEPKGWLESGKIW
ncbi:MAG: glycosyltransferase family A protein [Nitrospiria bacterium]